MRLILVLSLIAAAIIHKRAVSSDSAQMKKVAPAVAFWEQQGVDAIVKARGSTPFDYTKYVDSSFNPDVNAILKDYTNVVVFLVVCIFGMIFSVFGGISMFCCCVISHPVKIDTASKNRKICSIISFVLLLLFTLFLTAMTLSSLQDLSTGATNTFFSTSALLSSADDMISNAKSSISYGFKHFDIDFDSAINGTESKINLLIAAVDDATSSDGSYIDACLNNMQSNLHNAEEYSNYTRNNASFLLSNVTTMRSNFTGTMNALVLLDGFQNYSDPNPESYKIKTALFQQFQGAQFESSIDEQSASDLSNTANPFNIEVPDTFIGQSIHLKIADLYNQTSILFKNIRSSLQIALNAVKTQLAETDIDSLDPSILSEPSKSLSDLKPKVTSYIQSQSTGVYIYMAIIFILLIASGLLIAFKHPRTAMTSLCLVAVLMIVAFVLSFIYYILAFVIGEACFMLSTTSNTGYQRYTSAGLAAQDLCIANKSLLDIFRNDTVNAILPSGFDRSILNLSKVVRSQIEKQSLNMSSLDNTFSTTAFDVNQFNKLFKDVHGIDASGFNSSSAVRGSVDPSTTNTLSNAVSVLQVANGMTVNDFDHYIGSNSAHLIDYKAKIIDKQSNVQSVLNRNSDIEISKNNTRASSDSIFVLLEYSNNNITLVELKMTELGTSLNQTIADATIKSKSYFNNLIYSIADMIVQEIEHATMGANCFEVGTSMQALTNSICVVTV